ncbi:MAG TPA: hypothetical protein VGX03_35920 [Candidatus Binatia bacterium]|jgi:hypothetical protein|nr:hypothetical protein [Candidatus Binatia bacterium]
MQTMPVPALAVASSVPGRMRLKLPPCDLSGREHTLKETMNSICGVTDLRWTKITNSLVVHYDHRRASSAEILDQCQRALVPLVVPTTSVSTFPLRPASVVVQSVGHAIAGKESTRRSDENPASTTPWGSLSPGKRLLGVFLVAVGAVLFILPFVPGLPILLMGLTLLQLG